MQADHQPSLLELHACPGECEGRGYTVGHEPGCYEHGDCVCSGVQTPCRTCNGSGTVTYDVLDRSIPFG